VSLMRFLPNSSIYRVDNYDVFCYSNKSAIVSKAKKTMQHLYGVQSSAYTNTSATNIPVANTSAAELCSIATDDITLSNEQKNSIAGCSNFDFEYSKSLNLDLCKKKSRNFPQINLF
jgi:hypothetical protein